MVVVVVTFFTSLAMVSTVFPMSVDTARIVCGAVFMKLSDVCLSVCPIAPRWVCCCGRHGQAISIDCCTARLQQARPPCDPYPRQHGAQQQMRAVTCLQRRSKLDTDLIKERLDHCKLHSASLSTLHVTQIGVIHVAPQVTAKFIYTIKVF